MLGYSKLTPDDVLVAYFSIGVNGFSLSTFVVRKGFRRSIQVGLCVSMVDKRF